MASGAPDEPEDARGLAPYSSSPTSVVQPVGSRIAGREHQADRVVDRCLVDRRLAAPRA